MATLCSHGHTPGYILCAPLLSRLHSKLMATPMATFYAHGSILHQWLHVRLHFALMATLMGTSYTHAYAYSWLRSWPHFTLIATLSVTNYTHGYTHPWVHFALMVVGTVTCTVTFTAYPLHDTFYRMAFTRRATRRATLHTNGYTHGYILHLSPRSVPHFTFMATLTHGYILQSWLQIQLLLQIQ